MPILLRFGEFAQGAGARSWEELPAHVESFVETWLKRQGREYSELQRQAAARGIRNPIQQLLRVNLPHHQSKFGLPDPFAVASSLPARAAWIETNGVRRVAVKTCGHNLPKNLRSNWAVNYRVDLFVRVPRQIKVSLIS